MVKRYHESFPSFSYEFDSRYPLQLHPKICLSATCCLMGGSAVKTTCCAHSKRKGFPMFKGLFLSLVIIVGGGIIGLPVLLLMVV